MSAEQLTFEENAASKLKDLTQYAVNYSIDALIPITKYLATCASLYNAAQKCYESGDFTKSYIFYMRFTVMVIEKISKHPQYYQIREDHIKSLKKDSVIALNKLEEIKPILKNNYIEGFKKKALVDDHKKNAGKQTTSTENNRPTVAEESAPSSLRKVRISRVLASTFEKVVSQNSSLNIESCGTLCGNLVNNEYHITDIVLPKQEGTSDSCTTLDESPIFNHIIETGMIVLGWIHTHPSQTAFLSSVDQHCQLSYQLMIPEAIAIVVSPKHNETGYFSLTADHGIEYVRNCRERSFHPHDSLKSIYLPSEHIIYDDTIAANVKDFRTLA